MTRNKNKRTYGNFCGVLNYVKSYNILFQIWKSIKQYIIPLFCVLLHDGQSGVATRRDTDEAQEN